MNVYIYIYIYINTYIAFGGGLYRALFPTPPNPRQVSAPTISKYRGTSPIRDSAPLGPYSRTLPRTLCEPASPRLRIHAR